MEEIIKVLPRREKITVHNVKETIERDTTVKKQFSCKKKKSLKSNTSVSVKVSYFAFQPWRPQTKKQGGGGKKIEILYKDILIFTMVKPSLSNKST